MTEYLFPSPAKLPFKSKMQFSTHVSDFYSSLLQTAIKTNNPFVGKSSHAQIVKSGLHLSVFLMNNLINFYGKCGFLSDAHKVFDEMPDRNTSTWNTLLSAYAKKGSVEKAYDLFVRMPEPDSVSWTAMIVGFNQMGCEKKAIRLFVDMFYGDVSPTQFTVTNVLASCASLEALDIGRSAHSFIVKLGLAGNVSVQNSLMNMYAKTGDSVTARIVFDMMNVKNVSSWNAMIALHMQSGKVDFALNQFEQMSNRDIVSWNSMITGYNRQGFDVEALQMFSRMLKETLLKPDKFTLASSLSACANLEDLKFGKQIHAHIIRNEFDASGAVGNSLISMYSKSGGVDIAQIVLRQSGASNFNVIAYTALLDGYIKLGNMKLAREIFDSLKECDVVTWTAMIVGYMQNDLNDEAIDLFRSMVQVGPMPNSYTLAATLSVCSSLASLNHGKQVHARALRLGEALSVSVSNALITMYSKSGSICEARQVFNMIHGCRDTVSWTSMILALAQHGHGQEAISLFEKMLEFEIKPDHITFVGVLSACIHVGLVEQGRRYYDLMKDTHKIEPTHSHYACMIDLYGRSGLLKEAQNFIDNMPIEPDVVAWGSLLSSCRVHKNTEMAQFAANRLLLIDPENSGAYSALANVYAACGKWVEAAKVRKSMKDKQVKKEQGFSWVQTKDEVHVFGADDSLHPQRKSIYKLIGKIWEDIKKMGFVPNYSSVLHDLDDEVKDQMLRHHSEKLAIAFALLNTPDNSTMRIMKNLRVCDDCHSAIKFISKLVGREIIVRDATRFHHFKGGLCSCHDYW